MNFFVNVPSVGRIKVFGYPYNKEHMHIKDNHSKNNSKNKTIKPGILQGKK